MFAGVSADWYFPRGWPSGPSRAGGCRRPAARVGALDLLGGIFVLASIREFAPLITAIIVSGVAGTAITADLGARKIREELDALQVLGVDPVTRR